jgi:hypothetical protein
MFVDEPIIGDLILAFIVELRGTAIKLLQLVAISLMDIVERLNG